MVCVFVCGVGVRERACARKGENVRRWDLWLKRITRCGNEGGKVGLFSLGDVVLDSSFSLS